MTELDGHDGARAADPTGDLARTAERLAVGVDFGGSGIKAAVVDVHTGHLRTDRVRVATPQPATPERCLVAIRDVVERATAGVTLDPDLPIGVTVPAAAIDGIVVTASNISKDWLGFDAGEGIERVLGRAATILNDADAAGIAEVHYGAGRGKMGTVLLVTLGTGIGTALFRDGELVPNTELGHIEIRGREGEERASSGARERRHRSWEAWSADVAEFLRRLDQLLWVDLFIIGGGASKHADRFLPRLTVRPPVVAAELRNDAGIVGVAWAASAPRIHVIRPAELDPASQPLQARATASP